MKIPTLWISLLWYGTVVAYSGPSISSSTTRRGFIHRELVKSSILLPFISFELAHPLPAVAASTNKDVQLVVQTASDLKACTSDIDLFLKGLSSEVPIEGAPKLPSQISFKVFQSLAKLAKDVPTAKFEADDFLGLAAEYAEHAGSARDYSKLSKMGRIGENGSEEVVIFYAKKTANEVEETEKILKVLALAVE
mmetsp:Transcript_32220/g.36643  ORF Transcript_32220/g.36643 Transcript_32220/m.36643 type:complete len:194 (+) Transcript_32220:131-712(+)|eukprot:CAMPEP_0194137204 /NCGR_PEP_ID=MMETSP0152-20130528/7132_1 /TAXON_ID=1049557 /ORGANISM="Thalassiothrix antarctica, Strain L6-D1" /LENGTH=193 /DNA_ID=CAMNT_0038834141 /DNA_START=72 /DNA_END=653 /DNA_ORIENTATION=-